MGSALTSPVVDFALDAAVVRVIPPSPVIPAPDGGFALIAIREGLAFAFSSSLRAVERVTRPARRVYILVNECEQKDSYMSILV